jgi:uncharacterized OsmC-like protein
MTERRQWSRRIFNPRRGTRYDMAENATGHINGIDTDGLRKLIGEVAADPAKGMVNFRVATTWVGQTRCETKVSSWMMGGKTIEHSHTIVSDEPPELLGKDEAANPQEVLMAALNSCIMMGYVINAAMKGITLEKVVIETEGDLDLRGLFRLDDSIKPGYDTIHYRVYIKGNGTPEQFQEIHEHLSVASPNFYNISRPIKLDAKLIVE